MTTSIDVNISKYPALSFRVVNVVSRKAPWSLTPHGQDDFSTFEGP